MAIFEIRFHSGFGEIGGRIRHRFENDLDSLVMASAVVKCQIRTAMKRDFVVDV